MGNPICHFEICSSNMEKAREFYGGLFNWKLRIDENMNYTIIETVDGGVGGGIMQAEEGKFPPYVSFYVQVDDLDASTRKAEEMGAKIIVPPMPIPGYGRFSFFSDFDGNMIGLWSK